MLVMYYKSSYKYLLNSFNYDKIMNLQNYNHYTSPELKYITLTLANNSRELPIKQLLFNALFLEIISIQKPIILSVKRLQTQGRVKIKMKKNFIIGYQTILRKNNLYNFVTLLIFFIFPLSNFQLPALAEKKITLQRYISFSCYLTELKNFNLYSLFYLNFDHLHSLTIELHFTKHVSWPILKGFLLLPEVEHQII